MVWIMRGNSRGQCNVYLVELNINLTLTLVIPSYSDPSYSDPSYFPSYFFFYNFM